MVLKSWYLNLFVGQLQECAVSNIAGFAFKVANFYPQRSKDDLKP